MGTDKAFSLIHDLPTELVDRIYSQALHETTLPGDVMSLITKYNQRTNRLTNLASIYHRIRKITSFIARSTFSAVEKQYANFIRPSPYTGPVCQVAPEQYLCRGALALASLRALLPYMSEDCQMDLTLLIQHNFEPQLTRKTTINDKRAILNVKMLVLAGYEDCLELFNDEERPKVLEVLGLYHQEIKSSLLPGEKLHKVDDYSKIIKPRSEAKRHELEEMVTEVQNWILSPDDKAKIINNDAWYEEVAMKVGNVSKKISQDLNSDSIAELAYFVTRLAAIIQHCYKEETRLGVQKLGKYDSGSGIRLA
ncbi:uncharacterized protein FIESC28_09677 [Fusarium coffeatum]|uniref:Uncharacterized protein n=1 Tax=Fusarium coffeatum TaxID=231269 RepID=A0A366QYG5_9HYPO|nr:uncharacterized protein FIESC28_09677 [Fusarium coffeatum]RBR09931.1 hypothetical protein FIESC28_09677 [Fusarium coffeatum]